MDIIQNMIARPKWWAVIVLAVVLVCAAAIALPAVRRSILRFAGWALVVNERVEPTDVIVLSVDTDGAGVLEAADLVDTGVATRVAVFADLPNAAHQEFIRRGISYDDEADRSIRQLSALGIETVERIPKSVAGTEDEGLVLADWCDRHRFNSVIVVVTSDHSRRLRRILHRSLKGHQTSIIVHPARYCNFDPDEWWKTRGGIRTEIEELEKLLLDMVRHPIS